MPSLSVHDLGTYLREQRESARLSVRQLSELAGVSNPYLSQIERGIVPEYEIFDLGHLAALQRLLGKYGLPAGGHVHVDFVMGVPGGMPGTAAALVACAQAVNDLPEGTTFSATGIGRTTLPVLLCSLSAGGHLRVGMEDTVTYEKGKPVENNAQLVARAAAFARLAQRPPLSTDEARAMLGVG
jgi:uncharacterized protein (DUF849 family)